MPEFAGVFHSGGVIPGPPGAERLALLESGETVIPRGGGDSRLLGAVERLTDTICAHDETVRANTGAVSDNTRGSRMSYSRGAGLSSDRVSYLNVGS
jgi:hypothetical protein